MAALSDISEHLTCPVCAEQLKDPFVTPCGHSFCYSCVMAHLQVKNTCPGCSEYLTVDKVYPNHLLSKIVANCARIQQIQKSSAIDQLQAVIASSDNPLKLCEIEGLLKDLEAKRKEVQQNENTRQLEVLLHFLEHSRGKKVERLDSLNDELNVLNTDINHLLRRRSFPALFTTDQTAAQALPASAAANEVHGRSSLSLSGAPSSSPSSKSCEAAPLEQIRPSLAAQLQDHPRPCLQEQQPETSRRRMSTHDLAVRATPQPILHGQHSARRLSAPLIPPSQQGPAFEPEDRRNGFTGAAQRPLPSAVGHIQPAQAPAEPLLPTVDSARQLTDHLANSHTESDNAQGRQNVGPRSADPLHQAELPSTTLLEGQESRFRRSASALLRVPSVAQHPPLVSLGPDLPMQWLIRSGLDHTVFNVNGPGTPASGGPLNLISNHGTSSANLNPPSPPQIDESSHSQRLISLGRGLGHQALEASRAVNGHVHASHDYLIRQQEQEQASSSLTPAPSDRRSMPEASSGSHKRRMEHFEDLQSQYFKMREKQLEVMKRRRLGDLDPQSADATPFANEQSSAAQSEDSRNDEADHRHSNSFGQESDLHLDRSDIQEFSRTLSLYAHRSRLQVLASISSSTPRNSAAILSGLAFNMDCKLFAAAGVSKRIALYDLQQVLSQGAENEFREAANQPLAELMTPAKLSCISWNQYKHGHLLSSDYEGVITLWDTDTQQTLLEFEAHQKRIWSVEFSPSSAHCLASASDDGLVKLWSTTQQSCISEISLHANVCCAQYNPFNEHELAAGCADHKVHVFDLRKARHALHSFAGHSKSVSYVRYLSSKSVVSASTDSTLKLWDQSTDRLIRTYDGHRNCKNFVGLAADSEFIATGSETKEVYVYYKSMSRPVAKAQFTIPPTEAYNRFRSGPAFISALCWQPRCQDKVLLAGSSQGTLKLLKLVSHN